MPHLADAIRYTAAIAATEDTIRTDGPQALVEGSIEDWIEKITALLGAIDDDEALAILADVEATTSAFATGRYVLAVLSMIRTARAIAEAVRD
jgi:hypothetical protein